VLVAVEHVQVRGAHQRQQLAHAGLARACLAHQQHWLLVAQTPEGKDSGMMTERTDNLVRTMIKAGGRQTTT
jgi:hypothetical protein